MGLVSFGYVPCGPSDHKYSDYLTTAEPGKGLEDVRLKSVKSVEEARRKTPISFFIAVSLLGHFCPRTNQRSHKNFGLALHRKRLLAVGEMDKGVAQHLRFQNGCAQSGKSCQSAAADRKQTWRSSRASDTWWGLCQILLSGSRESAHLRRRSCLQGYEAVFSPEARVFQASLFFADSLTTTEAVNSSWINSQKRLLNLWDHSGID